MMNTGNKISNDYFEYNFPQHLEKPTPASSSDECRLFVQDKYVKRRWAPKKIPSPTE